MQSSLLGHMSCMMPSVSCFNAHRSTRETQCCSSNTVKQLQFRTRMSLNIADRLQVLDSSFRRYKQMSALAFWLCRQSSQLLPPVGQTASHNLLTEAVLQQILSCSGWLSCGTHVHKHTQAHKVGCISQLSSPKQLFAAQCEMCSLRRSWTKH